MARSTDLLALVHADPRDRDARVVYGDALLEAGDPRGELIALQVERARTGGRVSRREAMLISANWARWLGPIADALDVRRSRLALGFLQRAALRAGTRRRPMTDATLDHHEWRTVELLDARSTEPAPLLCGEAAELLARVPSIATLIAGPNTLHAARARVAAHGLERLWLTYRVPPVREVLDTLDAGTFPRLRVMRLWGTSFRDDDAMQIAVRLGTEAELELAGAPDLTRLALLVERLVTKVRGVGVLASWGRIRATLAASRIAIDVRELDAFGATAFRVFLNELGADRVVLQLREPQRALGSFASAGFAITYV